MRVGSMRGVKPKTHRANPVVTQGQTGHPRADSTAPNPERRCGCGTRHDCATVSAQTTGSFHAAACQKRKQPASRCQSFVLSHVSALRLSRQGARNRPPATRNRSRALPAACHNGTAPVARSCVLSHRRYGPHSPADELSYRASSLILSLSKGGGKIHAALEPALPPSTGSG